MAAAVLLAFSTVVSLFSGDLSEGGCHCSILQHSGSPPPPPPPESCMLSGMGLVNLTDAGLSCGGVGGETHTR